MTKRFTRSRPLPRAGAALLTSTLTLTAALLGAGCLAPPEGPAVPLYPNAAAGRLPASQVARVLGPIAKIDGRDVLDEAAGFELLPGCHIVELDRQTARDNYALSTARYWTGQYPPTVYVIDMKAGARYVIQRSIVDEAGMGRLVLSAREEQANGTISDIAPAKAAVDLRTCRSE